MVRLVAGARVPMRWSEVGNTRQVVMFRGLCKSPPTRHQFPGGGLPGAGSRFADGMTSEGRQTEDRERRCQMLFAVTEVVLEVITPGLQDVERFVLVVPPAAATGGEFGVVLPDDFGAGDATVTTSHFSAIVADLDAVVKERNPVQDACPAAVHNWLR